MGFEKFEKHSGRGGSGEPKVSLRKSGTIGLNGKTVTEYFPDRDHVVLYFDEEENRVGLEPSDDKGGDTSYSIIRTRIVRR